MPSSASFWLRYWWEEFLCPPLGLQPTVLTESYVAYDEGNAADISQIFSIIVVQLTQR